MATFKPRLKAPSTTDKNYLHTSKGGYNYCIHIGGGSCLPNCVGYAWGRWRELLGKYHNLSRNNAENWWGYTADGYKRGQTPKLGAVVCWRKGKVGVESDGAGHVGIVEEINKDNIVVSMSAYGGTRWFTRTFPIGSYSYSSYVFQGFIYPPVSFTVETEKKDTTSTVKAKFAKGDKVKVKKAVTYDGKSFAVYYDTYNVMEVANDRVVIGVNGVITAAVKDTNLTKVSTTTKKAVKVGSTVKVKKGAKDYNGNSVASFIYNKVYKVDELNGKRAVLDMKGICTAFHVDNLIVQ